MLCDGVEVEAREQRVFGSIGLDLRGIQVELFTPDKRCLLALLHDGIEEAAEDRHAIAVTNARQARMVGERLTEVVAEIPAQTESVSRHPHELALRAQTLKKT